MINRSYLDKLTQKPMPNKKYKMGILVHFDNIPTSAPKSDIISLKNDLKEIKDILLVISKKNCT